ncbi:uncharacterized protein BJX67DRAFT_347600 [Aspergillus lucknowensis]|uniref:Uncharacterized protein n=1 Tax=Aspergillus lucknowensis TaxID=176173 RepID=A0ABR4LYE0_9EURO
MSLTIAPLVAWRPNVVYDGKDSNSILVKSKSHARELLDGFLRGASCEEDLLLHLPRSLLDDDSVSEILQSVKKAKRKYTYDPERRILKVFSMARPVHDAFVTFAIFWFNRRLSCLTAEEEDSVLVSTELIQMTGVLHTAHGKKSLAWRKYPDLLVQFGDFASKKIPRLVIEVGFSESYGDLRHNAHQWLEKSYPRVPLVMIVKIEEDVVSLKRRKTTPEYQSTLKHLIANYGSSERCNENGIDGIGMDASSDSFYKDLESEISICDWVGPLRIFLSRNMGDGLHRPCPS